MTHHWQAWRQLSQEFNFAMTAEQLLGLAGTPTNAILELLCEQQVRLVACPTAVQPLHPLVCLYGNGLLSPAGKPTRLLCNQQLWFAVSRLTRSRRPQAAVCAACMNR